MKLCVSQVGKCLKVVNAGQKNVRTVNSAQTVERT